MDYEDITIEDIISECGEDKLQWLFNEKHSKLDGNWLLYEDGNHEIIKFCEKSVMVKLYFYNTDKEHIVKDFILFIPNKWL